MVTAWLGIPYARAARFEAPKIVPFNAGVAYDRFGPAAPQSLDSPLGELVPGMRVDAIDERACLTLNVWAPAGNGPHPVLVWFHGGSFVIGSSASPVYDGTLLATEQDVVVVTVNYRLGAFGFLDARRFGGVANCGLRDALCALTWIRDHVDAFGGDPARVVAFGESAGGGVVLHALASPRSRGLLAGAIVQSGATFATLDDERAAVVVDTLEEEAGQSLRDLPIDGLIDAQTRALSALLQPIGMMPFHPMVDGDVLPAALVDALDAPTPLVLGTTSEEMALFVRGSGLTPERIVKRVARYLRVDDAHAAQIVAAYDGDPDEIWCAIFSDNEMQRPARAMLDAHAPHGPTYNYLFTWGGPDVGACHGIDIPFPFGNFVDGWDAFAGLDDDARALSRRMRDAWGSFARTCDPGWPQYPQTMIFGRQSHVAPRNPAFGRCGTV